MEASAATRAARRVATSRGATRSTPPHTAEAKWVPVAPHRAAAAVARALQASIDRRAARAQARPKAVPELASGRASCRLVALAAAASPSSSGRRVSPQLAQARRRASIASWRPLSDDKCGS